jgi:probable LLM family oxidoreductase
MTVSATPSSSPTPAFELGLYTFGPSAVPGISPQQQMRELILEGVLADQVGLDVFGVGEHHRADFLVSSPVPVLSAIAARTERIRLSSAVTVLGSEDPVRVFQAFATLDLISNGRAEIMAGRGSFSESFPLFLGGMPADYDGLFAEKLELLLRLREETVISWQGQTRPALRQAGIYPRPAQDELPVWLAVGGTPDSAVRAGQLGLPMALAIIGGQTAQFVPFTDLYRRSWAQSGRDPAALRLGINSHGLVADTSQGALDIAFPAHSEVMNALGRERGWSPVSRASFEAGASLRGALVAGDPEQVAEKIVYQHRLFGHHRFLMQMGIGTLPHADVMRSIELYGTEVAPLVRRELAAQPSAHTSTPVALTS